jgi:hypothetical protein
MTKPKKLVRVHTRLDGNQSKKIAQIAKKQKISQAQALRDIVDYYFLYQRG